MPNLSADASLVVTAIQPKHFKPSGEDYVVRDASLAVVTKKD
jgi:hypothetical protein